MAQTRAGLPVQAAVAAGAPAPVPAGWRTLCQAGSMGAEPACRLHGVPKQALSWAASVRPVVWAPPGQLPAGHTMQM